MFLGLTRLIEVIKKYKIVDNQTARASPISALFRLARSAWKILILHSVRAKTNYRLNTARQSLAGGRVREFIHYLGALPRGTIFSCGFAHRSRTTARKILGKCLELGEARKSYACNFFAFDFIYSTLLLYELPLCVSFCFADYYKFIRQFIN